MASKVTSKIEINKQFIKELQDISIECLALTAEATMTEIDNLDIIPKLSGDLEANTKANLSNLDKGEVNITSEGPYARRLYYNAQDMNISQAINNNAKDHWFQDFIDGKQETFIEDSFKKFLSKKI